MKRCPSCKKTYDDDSLNFCLVDGSPLLESRGEAVRHTILNEIVAIAVLALTVLVFLCLVSYDQRDPTFNTSSSFPIQNWIGFVGANLAEFLLTVVGAAAYLLPALMAVAAWRIFQSEDLRPSIWKTSGFVLFVASLAGIIHMIGWHGGLVGAFVAENAVYLLSSLGAAILLLTLFVLSLILITNLSVTTVAAALEMPLANVRTRLSEWWNRGKLLEAGQHDLPPTEFKTKTERPTIVGNETRARLKVKETKADIQIAEPAAEPEPIPPTIIAESVPDTAIEDVELPPELEPRSIKSTAEKPAAEEKDYSEDAAEAAEKEKEAAAKKPNDFSKYKLPLPEFLNESQARIEQQESSLLELAEKLATKTKEFNVSGKVVNICPGPVVTTYEFKPDPGVKYSRVTGLVDDLCLALQAESIRIDRIPGKAFVGIEVPNEHRQTIALRDVITSKKFESSTSKLTIALGKTIDGLNYVSDLAKMPHLLIAGATGAGKSVGVNSLVVSILYKAKPDEVKFIMVDPKRLELGLYEDIPHLATPIIKDPKRAATALKWAVSEMERRYKDLAGYGVRNIDGYNVEAEKRNKAGNFDNDGNPHRKLPYIVIIIDELADLMMVSGKEVEESITRLAQMARAVGIHLVLATQRPSVDVITGLIKANFPARISFRVSSKIDSRTIIDGNGAEGLLGRGDMLFLPPASSQVVRIHGANVDEKEIEKIVDHIKKQGSPEYDTTITKTEEEMDDAGDLPGRRDPLFVDALRAVVEMKRASTSGLQRRLRIGYGRAAAILDAMVGEGYIGEMDGSSRARPVLEKAYEELRDLEEMQG
jgi:S-DNA-T family DNA segregation ATPase FtsK/SpoIIIE